MEPTDKAIAALERRLKRSLGQEYAIEEVEVMASFEDLLGTDDASDK